MRVWDTVRVDELDVKNVSDVVDVCHASGIANKVVRLKPMGVVKG